VLFLVVFFILSEFTLFSTTGLSSKANLNSVHGSRHDPLRGLGSLDRCLGVQKPRQILNTDQITSKFRLHVAHGSEILPLVLASSPRPHLTTSIRSSSTTKHFALTDS
jgi:hypothetical protein